jgi:phosphatidylinositol glycan class C protein
MIHLNLLLFPGNKRYPGSLSTNAAIFASVLLASRLPSNVFVFGLMLFAVEWFALFPLLRRSVKVVLSTSGYFELTLVF